MEELLRGAAIKERWPQIVNICVASRGELLRGLPVLGYVCFEPTTQVELAHAIVCDLLRPFLGYLDPPPCLTPTCLKKASEMQHTSFWGTATTDPPETYLVVALFERGYLTPGNRDRMKSYFEQIEEDFGSKTAETLLVRACQHFGITLEQLTGAGRQRKLAHARHDVAFVLKLRCQLTLKEIGRLLGNRDHSSIMHAIRSVQSKYQEDTSAKRRQLLMMTRGWRM